MCTVDWDAANVSSVDRVSNDSTAIEFDDVVRRFGRTTGLTGLTFAVPKGAVAVLAGPNGSGKSTAIAVLAGWLRPSAGRASFSGRRYQDLSSPAQTVGFVSDVVEAHPMMTASEALKMVAMESGTAQDGVPAALNEAGLARSADRRVGDFSLGMRRRLSIAAALLPDPEVLVLDEPTNGLDDDGVTWFLDILRARRDRGHSALVATHQRETISAVADLVVEITDGRLDRIDLFDDVVVARCVDGRAQVLATAIERSFPTSSVEMTSDTLTIRGVTAEQVARSARGADVLVTDLRGARS